MIKQARRRRAKLHVIDLRGRPAREVSEDASPEDERELERLLQLLRGRGEFDWGKLDARHRAEGKSRD